MGWQDPSRPHWNFVAVQFDHAKHLEGPCWIWIGGRNGKGYAQRMLNGKMKLVHRHAYEVFKGPIPEKWTVDHLCSNRTCCNPAHLEAVTLRENVQRGVANRQVKFSDDDVRQIRALKNNGTTYKDIARIYGISKRYAADIVRRRARADVR